MCDRIEAATFMAAALVTRGEITVRGARFDHVRTFADVVVSCGGTAVFVGDSVTVSRASPFLVAVPYTETAPFPGFATDTQSIALALFTLCRGVSCVHEKIFFVEIDHLVYVIVVGVGHRMVIGPVDGYVTKIIIHVGTVVVVNVVYVSS